MSGWSALPSAFGQTYPTEEDPAQPLGVMPTRSTADKRIARELDARELRHVAKPIHALRATSGDTHLQERRGVRRVRRDRLGRDVPRDREASRRAPAGSERATAISGLSLQVPALERAQEVVEARGIEPRSEDASERASTCVSARLNLARRADVRRPSRLASSSLISLSDR